MPGDLLLENNFFVRQLQSAIVSGEQELRSIPMLIKEVVEHERWRRRILGAHGTVEFKCFEEFVEAKPLPGLGATVRQLQHLCHDDKEALDAIDRATKRNDGGDHSKPTLYNIQGAPSGTSHQATLRRLRKDRPDLHKRVLAGELTAHRAAIMAGFRKPTIILPLDPVAMAKAIRRHLNDEQLELLIKELKCQ